MSDVLAPPTALPSKAGCGEQSQPTPVRPDHPAQAARQASSPPEVAFARPDIGDAEVEAVLATLQSGWLTTGPRVEAFEQAFARYVGAPHAVAVSSCSAALHLSLLAADVAPGAEVVTTPMTFCATANAIIHCGATPVFADIERDTMNVDPGAVAAAMTSRTAALLPVHFAGRPADMRALRTLAHRHGLSVVDDAAHALGGSIDDVPVGGLGDLTCFSFYSTKNLTTGEGGMVTTSSPTLASAVRVTSRHGLSRSAWSREQPDRAADYEVVCPGFKYNMTDLQAAIGLEQLARADQLLDRRRRIWARYDAAVADLPVRRPQTTHRQTVHACHLYTLLVDPAESGWSRDELRLHLGRHGIQTSIHFRALHLHSYYADRFGLRRGMFPEAEYVSDHTLSLPLSSALGDADVDRVIDVLRRAFGEGHG